MRYQNSLISLLGLMVLLGCTSSNSDTSSLAVSITNESDSLKVSGYEVLEQPFKKSYRPGRYQIHLLDANDRILQKISFDQLTIGGVQNDSLQLVVPLLPALHRIALYKLDGSSGHYQLTDSRPLLRWKLPADLREVRTANSK